MSEQTTGVACDMASITGSPKPSCRLGNVNRAARNNASSRSARTGPVKRMRLPSARAGSRNASAAPSHPFGPTMTSRCGRIFVALDEPPEPLDQHRDVLAGLERSHPQHVGGVADRERLPGRRHEAVANLALHDAVGHDPDPFAWDRRASRDLVGGDVRRRDDDVRPLGRGGEPPLVEPAPPPRVRVGEEDRRRVVDRHHELCAAPRRHRERRRVHEVEVAQPA